jgi:hypothetical protein
LSFSLFATQNVLGTVGLRIEAITLNRSTLPCTDYRILFLVIFIYLPCLIVDFVSYVYLSILYNPLKLFAAAIVTEMIGKSSRKLAISGSIKYSA